MSDENTPLREQVAAEVRSIAARKRVTRRHLAEVVGVSEASMSRRMNGLYPFSVDELEAVADDLHVSVADLLPKPRRDGGGPGDGNPPKRATRQYSRASRLRRVLSLGGNPVSQPDTPELATAA